ncbi:ABC transporter ATP-binding protein [Streptomyces sp. NPDC002785]|uniref:ABC transporter ATP-binding protein n=1 Tax=Streptomyces sp. NPDC002785 TaxID=3154543 RepID=UPI0033210169
MCDEPVSTLDASAQTQILDLLDDLQQRLVTPLLFVSHDLSVIRRISDRVLVMNNAEVAREEGTAEEMFEAPRHPYTKSLLAAVVTVSTDAAPPWELLETGGPGPTRPGTPPADAARPH